MNLTMPRFNTEFIYSPKGIITLAVLMMLVGISIGYQLVVADCNDMLKAYEQQCRRYQSSIPSVNATEIFEQSNMSTVIE